MNQLKRYDVFIGLLLVSLLTIRYAFEYPEVADLSFVDEHFYINQSYDFLTHKPPREYSPLYIGFISIFTLFSDDPMVIQNSFHIALTLGVVMAFYFLLIHLKVPVPIAILFAWLYLLNPLQLPVSTKVQIFCSLLVFIVISIGLQLKRHEKLMFYLVSFFVLCYARPEFMISLIILSGLILLFTIYFFYTRSKVLKFQVFIFPWYCWLILSVGLFFSFLWGHPFYDGSNRTFGAFAQHFAYNLHEFGNIHPELNPFLNYDIYIKEYFGNVQSIGDAIQSNPKAFMAHIFQNIRSLLWITSEFGFGMIWPFQAMFSLGKFSILVFGVGFLILIKSYRIRLPSVEKRKEKGLDFALILLCFLPSFIGQLIVAPRYHTYNFQYPLVSIFGMFSVFTLCDFKIKDSSSKLDFGVVLLVFIILLVCTPSYKRIANANFDKTNYHTLLAFREKLTKYKPLNILSDEYFLKNYIDPYAIFIDVGKDNVNANELIQGNKINVFATNTFMINRTSSLQNINLDSLLEANHWEIISPDYEGFTFYVKSRQY